MQRSVQVGSFNIVVSDAVPENTLTLINTAPLWAAVAEHLKHGTPRRELVDELIESGDVVFLLIDEDGS